MTTTDTDALLQSSIKLQQDYLAAYTPAQRAAIAADVAQRCASERQAQPSALKRCAKVVYGISQKEGK